jgi:hypothetical protein
MNGLGTKRMPGLINDELLKQHILSNTQYLCWENGLEKTFLDDGLDE